MLQETCIQHIKNTHFTSLWRWHERKITQFGLEGDTHILFNVKKHKSWMSADLLAMHKHHIVSLFGRVVKPK